MMAMWDEALKIVARLKVLANQKYVPSSGIASIFAFLGEKDLALAWLEKASEERDSWRVYLKVMPEFGRLRSDPRFWKVVNRVGLPQ